MTATNRHKLLFGLLGITLIALFLINIGTGSVSVPLKEILNSLTGNEVSKKSWEYIILNYRLPKAFTAISVSYTHLTLPTKA